MPIYVYTDKQTEAQIEAKEVATVLALVDAPNPAKADKAFLAERYERRGTKTAEALKLSKAGVPFIEVAPEAGE